MTLESELYHTRRYNRIVLAWAKNQSAPLPDLLKETTRIIYRYREFFDDENSLNRFYRFLEWLPAKWPKSFLSEGQYQSKQWLIQKLIEHSLTDLKTVYILGGWCGLSAHFILSSQNIKVERIFNIDIDTSSNRIADKFNSFWRVNGWIFKAFHHDMMTLNYHQDSFTSAHPDTGKITHITAPEPTTIINTCCEHIKLTDWLVRIPPKKLLILQSNNLSDCKEHINPHHSLDHFLEELQLKKIHYSGILNLDKYDRFMVIGEK